VRGFPAALTSFVGRDGPLREVAELLERYRLVTVTGPGGSGKTRLAGQVAGRVAGRFADGAWLVELAPVQDPAQVAGVVAAALGVREQPGIAEMTGMSRATAQRYLSHLHEVGRVEIRLRYGSGGRPEHAYRWNRAGQS
jgi:anion-transporting  ArsA/GET3 family ATPase